MTTSLIVFPLALGAGALVGNIRMDMYRFLGNGQEIIIKYVTKIMDGLVAKIIDPRSIFKNIIKFKNPYLD